MQRRGKQSGGGHIEFAFDLKGRLSVINGDGDNLKPLTDRAVDRDLPSRNGGRGSSQWNIARGRDGMHEGSPTIGYLGVAAGAGDRTLSGQALDSNRYRL
jgi:hypothetical protein